MFFISYKQRGTCCRKKKYKFSQAILKRCLLLLAIIILAGCNKNVVVSASFVANDEKIDTIGYIGSPENLNFFSYEQLKPTVLKPNTIIEILPHEGTPRSTYVTSWLNDEDTIYDTTRKLETLELISPANVGTYYYKVELIWTSTLAKSSLFIIEIKE